MQRIAVIAVENLRRYLAGEPLLNVVDMRAGY
jgi:phosphoglycerate dehydrogenase-like enzyme